MTPSFGADGGRGEACFADDGGVTVATTASDDDVRAAVAAGAVLSAGAVFWLTAAAISSVFCGSAAFDAVAGGAAGFAGEGSAAASAVLSRERRSAICCCPDGAFAGIGCCSAGSLATTDCAAPAVVSAAGLVTTASAVVAITSGGGFLGLIAGGAPTVASTAGIAVEAAISFVSGSADERGSRLMLVPGAAVAPESVSLFVACGAVAAGALACAAARSCWIFSIQTPDSPDGLGVGSGAPAGICATVVVHSLTIAVTGVWAAGCGAAASAFDPFGPQPPTQLESGTPAESGGWPGSKAGCCLGKIETTSADFPCEQPATHTTT